MKLWFQLQLTRYQVWRLYRRGEITADGLRRARRLARVIYNTQRGETS